MWHICIMSGAHWCTAAICIIFSLGDTRCVMFTNLESYWLSYRLRQSKVEENVNKILGIWKDWRAGRHLRHKDRTTLIPFFLIFCHKFQLQGMEQNKKLSHFLCSGPSFQFAYSGPSWLNDLKIGVVLQIGTYPSLQESS